MCNENKASMSLLPTGLVTQSFTIQRKQHFIPKSQAEAEKNESIRKLALRVVIG